LLNNALWCKKNAFRLLIILIILVKLGGVSKIRKAHFRRLNLHILVEKPHRRTTAPAFFVSICKPIQQNCIFQTLETL
jgi:hypothetical protein